MCGSSVQGSTPCGLFSAVILQKGADVKSGFECGIVEVVLEDAFRRPSRLEGMARAPNFPQQHERCAATSWSLLDPKLLNMACSSSGPCPFVLYNCMPQLHHSH